ncbi:MAG TPA: Asp23/Gls24 family envelope stress response protein [Anaerolineales bacterium]|nr:Asp23/Gls24 family envelope stress response protein [Anaerolineales bacterium]
MRQAVKSRREETMGEDTTSLGGIHISPNAVATIAYHATLESYGVVGLAPKNLADGLVKTITREPSRGVSVRYNGEDIDIDIHIIVEYGTRINSVAESVANTVRFHVEKALGLKVNAVNVHVAGLRISDLD